MFWHIDTDIVCLFFMVTLYFAIRRDRSESDQRTRYFRINVLFSIIMLLIDILASLVMDFPGSRLLYLLLETLYFCTVQLTIVFWCLYSAAILFANYYKRERIAHYILGVTYLIYFVVNIANIWTGWIFTVDENVVYQRGPMFAFTYIVYLIYSVSIMIAVFCNRRKLRNNMYRWLLVMLPLLQGSSIVVQLSFPGWLIIVPFYSIALFIAYLFLQDDWNKRFITRSQRDIQFLSKAANTDSMTGLLNHDESFVELAFCVSGEGRNYQHALFVIDVDDFKNVNDTYGHAAGDQVLINLAEHIRTCFRTDDIIGRIGGDEFMILMKYVTDINMVEAKAQDLLAALQADCMYNEQRIPVSISIGISFYDADKRKAKELFESADQALYEAKRKGKNCYQIA